MSAFTVTSSQWLKNNMADLQLRPISRPSANVILGVPVWRNLLWRNITCSICYDAWLYVNRRRLKTMKIVVAVPQANQTKLYSGIIYRFNIFQSMTEITVRSLFQEIPLFKKYVNFLCLIWYIPLWATSPKALNKFGSVSHIYAIHIKLSQVQR